MKGAAELNWLDQMEQALETLRRASPQAWLCFLTGMLPFALMLVYFVLEMLQSATARRRLVGLSLALSVAFVWKQCWQAAFVANLRDELAGERTPWTGTRLFRLVTQQLFWQPLALWALPAAALAVVPFPLALAFFREITLRAGQGERVTVRTALRAGAGEAKTHGFALAGFALLALFLWMNVFATVIMTPMLAQSIFGVVTAWSQMGGLLANRVLVGVTLILAWMLLDPLLDAFYLQRSFRREARESGADLWAALRRMAAGLALAALLAPASAQGLDPRQVDEAAKKVLTQDDYAWRNRMGKVEEGPVLGWFRQTGKWIQEKVDGFFDWLRAKLRRSSPGGSEGDGKGGAPSGLAWLLYGLSAIIVALALVLFYRAWRRSRTLPAAATAGAKVSKVDVADESLAADALEESGWLALADELMAQGDYRLALRALHLAGLRYLGGKGHVTLARWKSGYEYQRELERRLRATPEVAALFGGNLLRFEMVWYGRHRATPESVTGAREAWKEIRAHAG